MTNDEIAAELAKRLDSRSRVDAAISPSRVDGQPYLIHVPQIKCSDGFEMSVQASSGHYCSPRDSYGPWSAVEVGYPSAKVDSFMPYIDGSDSNPTDTVYGYVPIELVVDAIAAHGGFAAEQAAVDPAALERRSRADWQNDPNHVPE